MAKRSRGSKRKASRREPDKIYLKHLIKTSSDNKQRIYDSHVIDELPEIILEHFGQYLASSFASALGKECMSFFHNFRCRLTLNTHILKHKLAKRERLQPAAATNSVTEQLLSELFSWRYISERLEEVIYVKEEYQSLQLCRENYFFFRVLYLNDTIKSGLETFISLVNGEFIELTHPYVY